MKPLACAYGSTREMTWQDESRLQLRSWKHWWGRKEVPRLKTETLRAVSERSAISTQVSVAQWRQEFVVSKKPLIF